MYICGTGVEWWKLLENTTNALTGSPSIHILH